MKNTPYKESLRQLVHAVHDVQRLRQLDAAEDSAAQDVWDRLRVAVLESERLLKNPIDKHRR